MGARTDCFFNLSVEDRISVMEKNHKQSLAGVYRIYMGYVSLPVATVAFFLTSFFIYAVYKAIVARRVSRKCYILLLNRSVGDLAACITSLVVVAYVLLSDDVNPDVVSLMDTFFCGCFWSAMVSYVTLSLLKLFAVARPFDYRKCVTMKRCIKLCIFSWVMFMFMVIYTLSVTAFVKIPYLRERTHCRSETCLRLMYRIRNFFTVIVYFFTIAVFIATVILVRRAQRFVNSFKRREEQAKSNRKGRARFPLKKLALNVGTFAVLHFPYAFWCTWLLAHMNPCFFQRNFSRMMMYIALVRITLLVRIIVDPILAFITDFQKSGTVVSDSNSSEDAERIAHGLNRTRESTVKTIA